MKYAKLSNIWQSCIVLNARWRARSIKTWWKNKFSENEQCGICKTVLVVKCKKCLKEFSFKKNIVQHLKYVCYPEDEFKCSKCSFKAANVFRVREHYKSVHVIVSTECKKCGQKYKNPRYLSAHLRCCELEPKFQCDHCPFKSKFKVYVQNHFFRSHMELIVVDRGQSLKMSWQRFARTLTHLRAFCSKCEKEKRLNDRLKCKTKLYYKCKTCKKRYDVDDEKPAFTSKLTSKRSIECERCGVGSISKNGLTMHKVRCGAEFPCRFCKYVSNARGTTIKHEKSKHPHRV